MQSPATFEMLCPHEDFIQSEGLEEYYQHTVRRFVKGLTLVPDGMTIEQYIEQNLAAAADEELISADGETDNEEGKEEDLDTNEPIR